MMVRRLKAARREGTLVLALAPADQCCLKFGLNHVWGRAIMAVAALKIIREMKPA